MRFLPLFVILTVLAHGCASVHPPASPSTRPLLPQSRISRDSVGLEVGFVTIQNEDVDAIWKEIDEQHLPPEIRRDLQSNGFRCGCIGSQLPEPLQSAISANETGRLGVLSDAGENSPTWEGGTVAHQRRIQAREGQRSEVVTASPRASLVVLMDSGEGIGGRTFSDAQTVFELKAYPLGDGRARLTLLPEVHFGQSRQKWIGRDGMFQLESGKQRHEFSHLKIDATIEPGATLAVGSLGNSSSLGGNFFVVDKQRGQQKLLLIRLAQSQQDDLFAPPPSPESPTSLGGLTTELD